MDGLPKLGKEPYVMLKVSTVGIFLTLPKKRS